MSQGKRIYEFGRYRVDGDERLVWRDGKPVPLSGKPVDTLLLLLEHSGRLVEKSELLHEVWKDAFVEDGNVAVTISMLRKALQDDGAEHQYIQTVPRRGYRFVAEVRAIVQNERERPVAEEAVRPPLEPEQASRPPGVSPEPAGIAPPRPARSRSVFWIAPAVAVFLLVGIGVFLRVRTISAARPMLHSVAVLPFRVLSSAEQVPVGLTIADAVITDLGSYESIDVRPTSAILKYGNAAADPIAAGREQKVDAILTGNVEFAADHLRVNVQLVRVADASLIWAERFEEPAPQHSPLDDEIADRIVQAVASHFGAGARNRAAARQPQNAKAYQLYMQGRYFWNKRTEEGLRRSIEYFQQATLEDGQYAAAYAGLADSYALLASYGVEPADQAYPNAKAAASRALQLDPSLAEAYTSLGMIAFYYEWNWLDAERQFRRSIALNPNYPLAHTWYALDLAAMGRCPEAVAQIERAHDLDPLSLSINTEVGRVFYWCRNFDRAVDSLRNALDLDQNFARAHTRLGMTYAAKRDFTSAIREFERARQLSGPDPYLDGLLAYAEGSSGQAAAARRRLNDLVRRSRGEFVPAFSVALACIGIGDRELALTWLAKAYQDRSTYMVYAKSDPLLDGVRSDPRFLELLKRMGLHDKALAATDSQRDPVDRAIPRS